MENNPGDSSSESDISDPWSIIDRDSYGPDDVPGNSSGRESINGEPSDGESLEVIDEEQERQEFKDAGMETDGCSVNTESDINEELIHPLPSAVSKEKKYLHHPNTYLNNRLNVLLAISLAAVTGLGLGHFIGLQEECPVLNESTASLLSKLQEENDLLRYKLNQLLTTRNDFRECEGWDCGPDSNFENKDILFIRSGLKSEIQEHNLQLENHIRNDMEPTDDSEHDYFEEKQRPLSFSESIVNLIHEDSSIVDDDIFENLINSKQKESIDFASTNKYGGDEHHTTILEIEDSSEDFNGPLLQDNEQKPLTIMEETFEDIKHNVLNKGLDTIAEEKNVGGKTKINEHLFDYENANNVVQTNEHEDMKSNVVLTENAERFIEMNNAHISASTPDNVVYLYSSSNEDQMKIPPYQEESASEYKMKTSDNLYSQQNYIYPENIKNDKETSSLKDNDLQQIKSTLELLKIHFDNDISPDTGEVLSSAITLASEYEQGLIKLQKTISDCKLKQSEFCTQFQKKMEVSISKLKDTSEELAEDIDEQMYKLLAKISRKLKKFKGTVQNKWCHLKNKYVDTNGWFQASIFLDCKDSNKKVEKVSSKRYEASHENIIDKSFQDSKLKTSAGNKNNEIDEDIEFKIIKPVDNFVTIQTNEDFNKHSKKNVQKKKNKFKQKNLCNEKGNDKHCKDPRNHKEYSNSRDTKRNEHNSWNKQESNKNTKHYKEHDKKYNKQFVTVNQSRSWPKFDSSSSNQKNVSGDWVLKMADGRAEQRKLSHKSDWLFDRADARKVRREKDHVTDNWYIERARERENCRYSPNSDFCKNEANYVWPHNKYDNENEEKSYYSSRWPKKIYSTCICSSWEMDEGFLFKIRK